MTMSGPVAFEPRVTLKESWAAAVLVVEAQDRGVMTAGLPAASDVALMAPPLIMMLASVLSGPDARVRRPS